MNDIFIKYQNINFAFGHTRYFACLWTVNVQIVPHLEWYHSGDLSVSQNIHARDTVTDFSDSDTFTIKRLIKKSIYKKHFVICGDHFHHTSMWCKYIHWSNDNASLRHYMSILIGDKLKIFEQRMNYYNHRIANENNTWFWTHRNK